MLKENFIVSALCALEKSQKVNRDLWLKNAGKKISDMILRAASTGIRELTIPMKDLIIGAENLTEGAEMFVYLAKELTNQGYTNKFDLNGNLYIAW